jgi:GNAT superfamily N-acetyltransferase
MIARAVGLMVAGLLALPAGAHAHGALGALDVLDGAVRLQNGLFEVRLRSGPPLLTHGADRPVAQQEGGADPRDGAERPPACADRFHQQVLYGRPLTAPDRLEEARPVIEAAIFNMNAELDRAAMESGGRHADYRVKCDAEGRLAIGTFVNARTPAFRDIVDAARLTGAIDPDADYTIFYDDPAARGCGIGSHRIDEQPGPANASNAGGGYAVLYADCWDGVTAMHENAHNMGAVQAGAPNATKVHGHCRDESDVMCYPDGAEGELGMLDVCAGGERFDCGYDDYFDVAPEPGEYLATHWNIGSAANRFIELSDPLPGDTAATACRTSEMALLAVDTLGCTDASPDEEAPEPDEEEEVEDAPVRIVRVAHLLRRGEVRVRLACPQGRTEDCHGRVLLPRRSGGKGFRLDPGTRGDVPIRLTGKARRAWARGRLRRVRVVARADDASADAERTVRLTALR